MKIITIDKAIEVAKAMAGCNYSPTGVDAILWKHFRGHHLKVEHRMELKNYPGYGGSK